MWHWGSQGCWVGVSGGIGGGGQELRLPVEGGRLGACRQRAPMRAVPLQMTPSRPALPARPTWLRVRRPSFVKAGRPKRLRMPPDRTWSYAFSAQKAECAAQGAATEQISACLLGGDGSRRWWQLARRPRHYTDLARHHQPPSHPCSEHPQKRIQQPCARAMQPLAHSATKHSVTQRPTCVQPGSLQALQRLLQLGVQPREPRLHHRERRQVRQQLLVQPPHQPSCKHGEAGRARSFPWAQAGLHAMPIHTHAG